MEKQSGTGLSFVEAAIVLLIGAAIFSPAGMTQAPAQTTNSACARTWHSAATAELASDYNYLNGVAAIAPDDVWAVGGSGTFGGAVLPWTVHWDGNLWQTVPLPSSIPTSTGPLRAVAATGSADVWTVGGADGKTLILHWDGTSWQVVPSPNALHTQTSILNGVAATATNDAWAVGFSADGQRTAPYALHWNGDHWQEQPVGSLPGSVAQFNAVTSVGLRDVWAVGSYTDERGNGTLIEHWDGSAWSTLPNAGGVGPRSYSSLQAVAASGTRDVWAVGFITIPTTPYNGSKLQTLIQHWNGTTWQAIASPNPGLTGGTLNGVSVLSSTDAWAVGGYVSEPPNRQGVLPSNSLILHWDGVAWTQVDSPNTDSSRNDLAAVTALNAQQLWAVGNAILPHTALIAEYSDRCVTPTPTRTPTATWTPVPTFAPPPPTSGPPPLPTNTPGLSGPPVAGVADPHLPGVLYFPIVGHSLQGGFRVYWEGHGGLEQFGYPLTEEFHEYDQLKGTDTTVQYFERARFEWHPENRPPYDILLGLLGRTVTAGRENEAPFQPQPAPYPPTWRYFPETGHVIAPELATYWETHGGLPIYGYPISNPFTEVNQADGHSYLVQYFERNRLEYHPELPDPYRVSLGLLGTEVLRRQGWLP